MFWNHSFYQSFNNVMTAQCHRQYGWRSFESTSDTQYNVQISWCGSGWAVCTLVSVNTIYILINNTPKLCWQNNTSKLYWQNSTPKLYWQNSTPKSYWQNSTPKSYWQNRTDKIVLTKSYGNFTVVVNVKLHQLDKMNIPHRYIHNVICHDMSAAAFNRFILQSIQLWTSDIWNDPPPLTCQNCVIIKKQFDNHLIHRFKIELFID